MVLQKISKVLGFSSLLFLLPLACKDEEKLPPLGEKLAGAVDIASSPSGALFYVLNSDYERRFDRGSILIIDPAAAVGSQKLKSMSVPRMGRSLHVAQDLMLITYADPEARAVGKVEVWDLANESAPALVAATDIDCLPLNGVLAPTQSYFAISCVGGDIYMGKNPKNTGNAPMSLELVRSYGYERRALYFYESASKTWLFGFPTDLDTQDYADQTLQDSQAYDAASDGIVNTANGIPDAFELTASARRRWQLAAPYQMFIYPVTDEEQASKEPQDAKVPAYKNFRFIESGSFTKPTISNQELRYVTYPLLEANGQFSPAEQIAEPNLHRYRTNFWEAKSGLENNASIFYLSQRGDYGAESNNVLRVVVNEAALATANASRFEQIFQVNRIYGYAIDRDNAGRYPSDFEFANLGGEPMLLVNSFRDLINFAGAPFYSVTRKLLEGPAVAQQAPSSADSTDFRASYYQLAVSSGGKVLTSSFYGNALYLFDAQPGISIKDQTPIRIE